MSDRTRTAYYCEGCNRLFDKEKHPPRRLCVELPRPNRKDQEIVDVFVCPDCAAVFVDTGVITCEREKATA